MQRPARLHVSKALPLLLICAACGPQIQAARLVERPPPAEAFFQCQPEPAVPALLAADADLFGWVEDMRQAGADCREKLAAVRGLILGAAPAGGR